MNNIDPNKGVFRNPSPIAQLSAYSDLMAFTLKFLSSQEAMKSRTVCTRWNEIISTQCIAPILYRELEPQVAPFLKHIRKTFDEYFSERDIPALSLNSVKDAYHYLGPIKWKVSLGDCLRVPDLAQVTPESIAQNIQNHFRYHNWEDDYKWRRALHATLSRSGLPPSTWNQLVLASGVLAEEWNQQLLCSLSSVGMSSADLADRLEKWGVKPDMQEPDFNPLVVLEKISAFIHTKVKGVPYFQLCALSEANLPRRAKASEFAFISDSDLAFIDGISPNNSIFFSVSKQASDVNRHFLYVNNQLLYDYFPCTLLGFQPQDYVGKSSLLLHSIIGQSVCFPINGQFFKFAICPANEPTDDLEKDEVSDTSSSYDDFVVEEIEETFERQVELNGWKCMSSCLYFPEDEFEKFKSPRQ
jgi:hypothetical protein